MRLPDLDAVVRLCLAEELIKNVLCKSRRRKMLNFFADQKGRYKVLKNRRQKRRKYLKFF